MSIYIKKLLQLLILSVISLTALSVPAGIVDTKHNLAHWSPYNIKAVKEDRVCIFCHTPHNAKPDGPLWSHEFDEGLTFKRYSSPTLQILVDSTARSESEYTTGGITGATKLCLGCHDGLTALGAITTGSGPRTIEMNVETLGGLESGYDDAGTVNIQNKHPVSFNYNGTVISAINTGKGTNSYSLPEDELYGTSFNTAVEEMVRRAGGKIECTICHDPHENKASDNRDILPFWVSPEVPGTQFGLLSSYEGVCISCHSTAFGEYSFPIFGEYTTLR